MIVDKIENAQLYKRLNPGIEKAFEYIKQTDFSTFLPGKYEIEDDKLFALVNEYETTNAIDSYSEAHKKYIDVQVMIAGSERIGFATSNNQAVVKEYSAKNDITFFDAQVDFFKLKTGMFAIFFTNDLHMPGIFLDKPELVKKVVVKVHINYSGKRRK